MNSIVVFPPSSERSKQEGSILKPDKYVATANAPWGPFGYGDTPQEAALNLKVELHKRVDSLPAYQCDERGITGNRIAGV